MANEWTNEIIVAFNGDQLILKKEFQEFLKWRGDNSHLILLRGVPGRYLATPLTFLPACNPRTSTFLGSAFVSSNIWLFVEGSFTFHSLITLGRSLKSTKVDNAKKRYLLVPATTFRFHLFPSAYSRVRGTSSIQYIQKCGKLGH